MKNKNELLNVYSYIKKLTEADDNEDEKENNEKTQEEKEKEKEVTTNNTPYNENPNTPDTQPPLKDQANIPIQDGAIPQDAEGIQAGAYDALDPIGNANIQFKQGNFATVKGLPKVTADKVAEFTQTLLPLVEVALIELLGSSNLYERTLAQCFPSFDNTGKISIEFTLQYGVSNFIGSDITNDAIQHDANYILDKIKPVGANITKCEINCGDGIFTLMGTI
jgi:hypothetical protein